MDDMLVVQLRLTCKVGNEAMGISWQEESLLWIIKPNN